MEMLNAKKQYSRSSNAGELHPLAHVASHDCNSDQLLLG